MEVLVIGVCEIDDFATIATHDLTRKVPINVQLADPLPSSVLNVVSRNTMVKITIVA